MRRWLRRAPSCTHLHDSLAPFCAGLLRDPAKRSITQEHRSEKRCTRGLLGEGSLSASDGVPLA